MKNLILMLFLAQAVKIEQQEYCTSEIQPDEVNFLQESTDKQAKTHKMPPGPFEGEFKDNAYV